MRSHNLQAVPLGAVLVPERLDAGHQQTDATHDRDGRQDGLHPAGSTASLECEEDHEDPRKAEPHHQGELLGVIERVAVDGEVGDAGEHGDDQAEATHEDRHEVAVREAGCPHVGVVLIVLALEPLAFGRQHELLECIHVGLPFPCRGTICSGISKKMYRIYHIYSFISICCSF